MAILTMMSDAEYLRFLSEWNELTGGWTSVEDTTEAFLRLDYWIGESKNFMLRNSVATMKFSETRV